MLRLQITARDSRNFSLDLWNFYLDSHPEAPNYSPYLDGKCWAAGPFAGIFGCPAGRTGQSPLDWLRAGLDYWKKAWTWPGSSGCPNHNLLNGKCVVPGRGTRANIISINRFVELGRQRALTGMGGGDVGGSSPAGAFLGGGFPWLPVGFLGGGMAKSLHRQKIACGVSSRGLSQKSMLSLLTAVSLATQWRASNLRGEKISNFCIFFSEVFSRQNCRGRNNLRCTSG